jgi:hypothetical protein
MVHYMVYMFTKGEVCLLGLFFFRATKAACAESIILLPLQALSATSLVFHGVFSERFCVLGLRSQVCD